MAIEGVLATLDRIGKVVRIPLLIVLFGALPYILVTKVYLPRLRRRRRRRGPSLLRLRCTGGSRSRCPPMDGPGRIGV